MALLPTAATAGGPAMTGFQAFAARGDVIEVRKPLFRDGTLRVGAAVGWVKRRAEGRTRSSGDTVFDYSQTARLGRTMFEVTGADVGGQLGGTCAYFRSEERLDVGSASIARPRAPLRMRCDFQRDGRPIGYLLLGAMVQPSQPIQPTARAGEVVIGSARLSLRTSHDLGPRGVRTDTAVGYWVDDAQGLPVAAIDTNGLTRVRVAVLRDPAQRDAALIAGIAIATFWDPGDTDD
ncbi:hypothetical protein ASE86_11640 [Sphingomonas sp. Leaf33]|nr:hypothetical protein ASE86_11640 [Sphingomonas sp. Leaf33]